jgi:FMNH2-dependent dimethyl sulfone monooxygenase
VPNVSGGLVTSTIEQRTDWSFEYNRKLARLAERAGFEYALSQVRYTASYGAEYQHESTSLQPRAAARDRAPEADRRGPPRPLASRRARQVGRHRVPSLKRPRRRQRRLRLVQGRVPPARRAVARARRAVPAQRRVHPGAARDLDQRRRRTRRRLLPDPRFQPETQAAVRPGGLRHPEIFQGGNSSAARVNGGRYADWYFSNGKSFEGVQEQLDDLKRIAAEAAASTERLRGFGLNGFVIVRDTEQEARDTLREIIAKAHVEAVEGFGAAVKQAGQSTQDKKGMWADSSFEDLVQYNDGFRTQLIGTPEQVAERIIDYRKLGVDLILTGFLHYHEEIERFGRDVLPIVRELEVENGLDPAAVPDPNEGLSDDEMLLSAAH